MARVAVIDIETTGFRATRNDRIVEIAIVVLDCREGVISEFTSLVNPDRDVGPTRVHGITASMVRNAPRFGDLLGHILDELKGIVAIAGHNVTFDLGFVVAEFARYGCPFPDVPSICTMRLAGGGNLESVCFDYDVERPAFAHSALHDARATAAILQRMLASDADLDSYLRALKSPPWPTEQKSGLKPLVRNAEAIPPSSCGSYLQKLAHRVHGVGAIEPTRDPSPRIAYAALLAQAMQDRSIDDDESNALVGLAEAWGLTAEDISAIHNQYLAQLQIAALADGVVSEAERMDIKKAAAALGICGNSVESSLNAALEKMTAGSMSLPANGNGDPVRPGSDVLPKTVCFTGESLCRLSGEFITRSMALVLVAERGITMTDSLTKKVEVLVVADPHTQSGKAQKARRYGIPLMQEFTFWRTIGVNVEW